MADCLIGLGANRGERATAIASAVERLGQLPGTAVVQRSRLHASQAAIGGVAQNEFLNAVVQVETSMAPHQLLHALHVIEQQLGRRRLERWGAREIDLDLLLYDDMICADAELVLPHARMAFRRFVLQPAAEIAPGRLHPPTGFTIQELLERIDAVPRRIVVTGAPRQRLRTVASMVATRLLVHFQEPDELLEPLAEWSHLEGRPTCKAAIEMHQRWQRALSGRAPAVPLQIGVPPTSPQQAKPTDVATCWVDTCWLGECEAMIGWLLPTAERRKFEYWQQQVTVDRAVAAPTLIVVLVGGFTAPHQGRSVREVEMRRDLDAALREQATRPRQAPWLLLDDSDPAWTIQEITAAIEAMQ